MGAIADFLKRMRDNRSGNAMMMVAAGMPALIGGAGFAVDMTQWYMWKAELQYAVDQAALAGAYARTSTATKDLYETRAQQEYAANLSKTAEFASDPDIDLSNWGTGTNNSVIVSATASKELPFSSFLTGDAATVRVNAQAAFEDGATYTSCLIAVDEDEEGAITIGGSAKFIAGCGIAALSDSDEAIKVDGSPEVDAGWLIAAGGIDDWFDTNTNDKVLENQEGLVDPFASLTPPTNNTARVYDCPKGKTTTTYTADQTITTVVTYSYFKAKNNGGYQAETYTGSAKKSTKTSSVGPTSVTVTEKPKGQATSITTSADPIYSAYVKVDKIKGEDIYERSSTVVTTVLNNFKEVTTTEPPGAAILEPGTYADLVLKCDTVFKPGIYVLNGGTLDVNAQYNVTGPGVMFVLKNGAGISINGGANVSLTAMSVSELEAAGVPTEDARKLAGMLIFEDRNSSGNTQNKINGNATTILNGTVYLPVSSLDVQGTAGVTSQCLMLVASTIKLSGNMEMTSFCPLDKTEDTTVLTTKDRVRLVS